MEKISEITIQVQSIIFKNRKESLLKAIRALKNAIRICHENGYRIKVTLVYGDASPEPIFAEEDVAEIRKFVESRMIFEYVVFGFNTGTAKGHNILSEKCESEYMMIMNPDIILEPNCLSELLRPFENPKVGMAEARQTPLEHAKIYDTDSGETEWASTACTIFKTEIFNSINGFDADTFFMYCDDLDFSWRLRFKGYSVIYQPSAVVYHAKNLSITGNWTPTPAEIYYSAEAAILLAYKWSNMERVNKLVSQFKKYGGDAEKKAAYEFEQRKAEGKLPSQIDPEHKVARFVGDEYCEMRFHFSRN